MSGTGTAAPSKERRDELVAKAQAVAEKAKGEKRELTVDEQQEIGEYLTEVKSINEALVADAKSRQILGELDAMAAAGAGPELGKQAGGDPGGKSLSLGEHFVKHAHQRMVDSKGQTGLTFAAPDFSMKAAADNHVVGGWTAGVPFLTDFDRTIVQALRIRLTVADLLSQGTISGNAISYLVEDAMEGEFETVAEGGAKPQIHFVNPTQVTDALKKIAGFIKMTDEFLEDADFLVSEINNRLIYRLGYFEEQQLLNGNGTGQNLLGLLNRTGIQTETAAGPDDNADALFRALTKIDVNSGLAPDGIVINPTDYQQLRLKRDGNDQYYGGGFFAGQYGQGGVPMEPPLWGQRTVVTPAIASGTALVGSYKMAATMYRKGGVRVEAATQHASDFTSNLVTVRAEERVALAMRVPLGFCKVTFDWTA
ncbi:phage major capsid protein [Mycobacterium sp. CSUR Q5927]|nr:phage major capsid protein [Mycobacterium sp. CSUR Q5927]